MQLRYLTRKNTPVVEGVGRYNKAVEQSNKKVSEKLNSFTGELTLLKEASDKILREHDDSRQKINYKDQQVEDATKQIDAKLKEFQQRAEQFTSDIDTTVADNELKKSIVELNDKLRDKLDNVRATVAYESERLETVRAKQQSELDTTKQYISQTLSSLQVNVECNIQDQVRALLDYLTKEVRPILAKLKQINNSLQICLKHLGQWIDNAKDAITTAETQVNKILECIDEGSLYKYPNQITQAAQQIEASTSILHGKFEELRNQYNAVVTKVKGPEGDGKGECAVKKLKELEENMIVPHQFSVFNQTSGEWDVSTVIKPLIEKIKKNVGNYLEHLKEALVAGMTAQNGLVVTSKKTPGLDAMIKKLGENNLKNKLGTFGVLFTTAQIANEAGNLGYCFEIVLNYLNSITTMSNSGWNTFAGRAGTTLKSSMQEKAAGIEPDIGTLCNAAAITGAAKLQKEVTVIVEKYLDVINKLDGTLEGNAEVEKVALQTHAQDVMNKIKSLCKDIRNVTSEDPDSAKAKLFELKTKYFADSELATNSINKIHSELGHLRSDLESGPIKAVEKFLKDAEVTEKHYVQAMQRYLKTQVNVAETALTTHARRRYVDSIKWLLEQFVEKVKLELSELPTQIEHDQHIGLKGFMEAFNGNDSGDNVNRLLSNSDIPTLCRSLETFFAPVKSYIDSEINRLDEEEHKKHPSLPRSQDPYTSKLTKLYAALSGLISHVYTSNKYDRDLPTKLDDLTAAVADLTTDGFPNPVTAMLQGVSGGCRELVGALGKVYISRYDGANVRWEHDEKAVNNCAKAFLTIGPAYFHGLHHLFYKGATEWTDYKVTGNAKSARKADELKKYLQEEGYDIDQLKDQTGKEVALRMSRGFARYQSFNENPENLGTYKEYLAHYRKYEGLLSRLFYYLDAYNHVGHLVVHPRPRHPSSVFDILLWLNGLPYNPVYHALSYDGFSGLFEKEEKIGDATADDDGPTFEGEEADTLPAYPKDITAASLADKLTEVTTYAEDVLLSILGYGHNDGIYACDFYTNAGKLAYPSSAAKCLDVLVELLYRLFHQLRFLYEQCSNSTQYSGWAECWYGQGVGGSSWKCNEKQCADQNCKQIADQTANQTCKQHPKCGVKSPLQFFLEDGLPGFLPHPYNKADCKLSCSAPNHFGKPCKTPMGFADISITASHTSKGSRLYKVLKEFCGTPSSPLTVLCSSLVCVLGRPPQTLGDMFAFYHLFITTWNDGGKKHKKEAFDEAVTKANLQRPYDELNVASVFNSSHSGKSKTHTSGDLISLVCSSKTAATCGKYLSPLSNDISATFSFKHADKYVSWMVYLTETFYILLQKMYEECNSKCGGATPKCRVAKCPKKCKANEKSPGSTHHSLCDSIINCPSTSSVLCTYGFTLVDRKKLSGTDDVDYKRTCNDLCNALKKVLDGESVLMQLFHSIDKFIYTIRFPFMTLTLALWLLSFLYLLHIMVIRLDLLHIKSHLHSPSSHRIAAQSLLAAARVNKLNRVFYLQP
ncbi:hypothetical protein BBBOND_0200030 [Babesia bigemina]|uniref:C3H1-type domain-containing protein n=1 Tax=Babesia bigemina TaxID=5866 RepID=A0A061D273_BABBI|nr:hypothetical protein BBBOND_0200030 [Babesia bigemina]CDR94846.1 hypothetical protein BBBOND_0200030 [Babesia bigemina]|eukprot:XP_012767032.1 hypothetical protein BBBOND_0200030 [Babesia bigemina]